MGSGKDNEGNVNAEVGQRGERWNDKDEGYNDGQRKRQGRKENAERTTSDGDKEDEEEESGTVHDSVKHAYTKDGDEGGQVEEWESMKVLGRYGSGGRSGQVVALADNPANSDLIDKRLDKDGSCAEYDGGMNVIAGSNSGEGVACGLRDGLE
jgi:hypothetical protein